MQTLGRTIPYTITSPGEQPTFTRDMEIAYVALLAESRKKKSSLLPGKTENLVYVKKVGYPLILTPVSGRTAVFDGLGLVKTIYELQSPPPLEILIEEILGSATSRSQIRTTLLQHEKMLTRQAEISKMPVDGLFSDREFLADLTKGIKTEASLDDMTTRLPCVLTMEKALKSSNELQSTLANFTTCLHGLRYLTGLIDSQVARIEDKTKKEIESVTAEYNYRISRLQAEINRNIFMLERKLETELEKVKQDNWKTISKLSGEKERLDNRLEKLIHKLDVTNERYQKAKRSRRTASKKLLRKRIGALRKEASGIQKNIKRIETEIVRVKRQSQAEETSLRKETASKIRAERTRTVNIETEKQLFVSNCGKELQNIRSLRKSVARFIANQSEKIASQIRQVEEITLPKQLSASSMIFLTMFCVKYRSQSGERYSLFPPCSPQIKERFSDRIGRTILRSKGRLEAIGVPAGEGLARFTENLGNALSKHTFLKDAIDSEEIPNMLSEEFGERIRKGADCLLQRGWITTKDIGFARYLLNRT